MELASARKRAIALGFGTGFAIGLAGAALLVGLVSWGALMKRQQDLASDWAPAMAVVVVERIHAGDPLRRSSLAGRPVPRAVVSLNAVLPNEVDDLAGSTAKVDLFPGDVLTRSALGLDERPPPAPAP